MFCWYNIFNSYLLGNSVSYNTVGQKFNLSIMESTKFLKNSTEHEENFNKNRDIYCKVEKETTPNIMEEVSKYHRLYEVCFNNITRLLEKEWREQNSGEKK